MKPVHRLDLYYLGFFQQLGAKRMQFVRCRCNQRHAVTLVPQTKSQSRCGTFEHT